MFFLTLKYKEINLQSNLATRKMRTKGGITHQILKMEHLNNIGLQRFRKTRFTMLFLYFFLDSRGIILGV